MDQANSKALRFNWLHRINTFSSRWSNNFFYNQENQKQDNLSVKQIALRHLIEAEMIPNEPELGPFYW